MASGSFQKAIVLVKQGDKEAAGKILRQITVENPQHVMAWMWLLETIPGIEDRVGVLKECLLYNPQHPQAAGAMAYFSSLLETQTAAELQIAFSPDGPEPGSEAAAALNSSPFVAEFQGPLFPFSEKTYPPEDAHSNEPGLASPKKERSHSQPFIDGTLDEKTADFLVDMKAQSPAPDGALLSVPEEAVEEDNPRVQQKFLNIWVILSILFVVLLLFLAYLRFEVIW